MTGLVNWEGLDSKASSVHSVLISDNEIDLLYFFVEVSEARDPTLLEHTCNLEHVIVHVFVFSTSVFMYHHSVSASSLAKPQCN